MHGPFKTKLGGDTIMRFTADELLPVAEDIRHLAIEISGYRPGFLEGDLRRRYSKLEGSYKDLSVRFVEVYHKWSTPDVLFEDLGGEDERMGFMADYFQSQEAVMSHFNEGFRLLTYIDRILTIQTTAFYNRVSIALASFAVALSVVLRLL